MNDSFSTRDILEVNGTRYRIRSLAKLGQRFDLKRLPYSMKILLENLLRHEDGRELPRLTPLGLPTTEHPPLRIAL